VKRALLLLGAVVSAAGPGRLSAQDLSLLLGGVNARYADTVSGSAGLLGGRLGYSRGATQGNLETSLARFTSGEWAAQLAVQGLMSGALSRRDAVGLALGGSLNRLQGGIWSSAAAAGPFFAHQAGATTTSLSLTGGPVRRVDSTVIALGTATLGLRVERGPWQLETFAAGTAGDTLRLVDWTGSVTWRRPAVELGLSGGARAGDLTTSPWWQARLEAAVTPWATVEASGGRYPRDVSGFTAGHFATVGVRLAVLQAPLRRASSASADGLRTERVGQGRVRVRVRVGDARNVAIAGEWNDWKPAPMRRDPDGRWSATLALRPGVYHCALLVDGARWMPPPGSPKADDEFGGQVGLLIVPEP
jgi:hypothetical protein